MINPKACNVGRIVTPLKYDIVILHSVWSIMSLAETVCELLSKRGWERMEDDAKFSGLD